jgi:hypothetical protein
MTEHKFTDEEIILAHRCCTDIGMGCLDCPFGNNENAEGCASLDKLVLDLINRQKAEIETLKDNNEHLAVFLAEAKAEAVKEFAERLKEEACYLGRAVAMEDIDNIAKELIGGGASGARTKIGN